MPRQSAKRPNSTFQWSDQDTFDFSTPNMQVTARPVDTYVRPVLSNDAAAVAGFAESMQSVLKGFENRKKVKHENDIKAGQRAQMKKEAVPEDASTGFIQGYENLEGMAGSATLRTQLKDFFENNWQLTPEEFNVQKDEIVKKHLEGRSDAYIDGILPGALETEKTIVGAQYDAQRKIISANIDGHIRQVTDGLVDTALDTEGFDHAKAFRATLTEIQAKAVSMGKSRMEVSELSVHTIGPRAVLEGKPELMLYAYEKDETHGGLRLIDTELKPVILQYIRQAEAERDTQKTAQKVQTKENEKKLTEAAQRFMSSKIFTLSPTDPGWKEVISTWHSYSDPTKNEFGVALDSDKIEHYGKLINTLRTGGNFAQTSDAGSYRKAYVDAKEGRLTNEDLNDLIATGALSRDDSEEIMKAMTSGSSTAKKDPLDKPYRDFFAAERKIVNKTGPFGEILDPNGNKRAADVVFYEHFMLEQHLRDEKNNGKYPTLEQARTMSKMASEWALARYPANYDIVSGEDKGEGSASGSKNNPTKLRFNNQKNK